MGNKKRLKQDINMVCDALFAECVAASIYNGSPDPENVEALLLNIINTRNDFVSRISHQEPGLPAKKYYRDLVNAFNQHAAEIADQIGNLN